MPMEETEKGKWERKGQCCVKEANKEFQEGKRNLVYQTLLNKSKDHWIWQTDGQGKSDFSRIEIMEV